MDHEAIVLKDVSYRYSKNSLGISKISFEVESGICFGLVGHNGAGKTTTIKAILNLIKPQSGSIEIFGKSAFERVARTSIGYLAELPYFYDYLSVEEVLKYFASLSAIPKLTVKNTISDALELVHFKKDIKTKLRELSKGELQRVAMAQAILNTPKLLILDEPFSGLDAIGRDDFITLIKLLKNNGTTIFMSSHILNDVQMLSDKVAILKNGELEGIFTQDEIRTSLGENFELCIEKNEQTISLVQELNLTVLEKKDLLVLEQKDEVQAQRLMCQVLELGPFIKSFQKKGATLEELFLKLTKENEAL